MGFFEKNRSWTGAGRMLSFSTEQVPIGWTLLSQRNLFAQQTSGNFALKRPLFWSHFGLGLIVKVEVGLTKKSFYFLASMSTQWRPFSMKNESILPATVLGMIFKKPILEHKMTSVHILMPLSVSLRDKKIAFKETFSF